MAHVSEKLRLVLARLFELPAFVFDLVEQPRILDRQRRLRRKGLDEIDSGLGKLLRRRTTNMPTIFSPRSSGASISAR
jgi:hypothetical protein